MTYELWGFSPQIVYSQWKSLLHYLSWFESKFVVVSQDSLSLRHSVYAASQALLLYICWRLLFPILCLCFISCIIQHRNFSYSCWLQIRIGIPLSLYFIYIYCTKKFPEHLVIHLLSHFPKCISSSFLYFSLIFFLCVFSPCPEKLAFEITWISKSLNQTRTTPLNVPVFTVNLNVSGRVCTRQKVSGLWD